MAMSDEELKRKLKDVVASLGEKERTELQAAAVLEKKDVVEFLFDQIVIQEQEQITHDQL